MPQPTCNKPASVYTTALDWFPYISSVFFPDRTRIRAPAGLLRVWVAGKTVWSPCYTRVISERFRDKERTHIEFFICLLYLHAVSSSHCSCSTRKLRAGATAR